jgi:phosphoribosylformimino-5-aminoimidazole carboxamide ribotide isomerase
LLQIIPAIDLREGACARILGDFNVSKHIYSADPLTQVLLLKDAGAKMIHITDLDGSFSGRPCNLQVIQDIVDYAELDIQLSGGVRKLQDIDTLINLGVKRVVLSAAMLRQPQIVAEALAKYDERLLAGIDGRDGKIAIEGFEASVSTTVQHQLKVVKELGMQEIVYTDLRRDASLKGPNFAGIQTIVQESGLKICTAGGISSLEAVEKLKEIGVAGAVIGKAIYTGAIDLKELILAMQ